MTVAMLNIVTAEVPSRSGMLRTAATVRSQIWRIAYMPRSSAAGERVGHAEPQSAPGGRRASGERENDGAGKADHEDDRRHAHRSDLFARDGQEAHAEPQTHGGAGETEH